MLGKYIKQKLKLFFAFMPPQLTSPHELLKRIKCKK